MFCPHCHNKIPDGSNICPLCYANLAGVKPQQSQQPPREDASEQERPAPARKSGKKPAYTKGSRGSRRGADRTPMIIAFGLILILVIIIAMIIRSMFSAGAPQTLNTPEPQAQTQEVTMGPNFMVFGQTPTPATVTATPGIEITPSPTPTTQPVTTYKTLRKGDQGAEVVTLQQALVELGYLNGATDGNFGTGTETAVKNFQAANGLDADGIAGKLTLEALFKLSSVTPMPEVTVGPGDILDLPG